MSRKGGRERVISFGLAAGSAVCPGPHGDAAGQDALNGASVKKKGT